MTDECPECGAPTVISTNYGQDRVCANGHSWSPADDRIDEAIQMLPLDNEVPLYEMAIGDRDFDLEEFDNAVEQMIEEAVCKLSENDIERIRDGEVSDR